MNNQEKYTEAYKDDVIQTLLDELEYLELWSVYNKDKYNELIATIRNSIKIMKEN